MSLQRVSLDTISTSFCAKIKYSKIESHDAYSLVVLLGGNLRKLCLSTLMHVPPPLQMCFQIWVFAPFSPVLSCPGTLCSRFLLIPLENFGFTDLTLICLKIGLLLVIFAGACVYVSVFSFFSPQAYTRGLLFLCSFYD